jgi:hypothetical protein
MIKFENQIRGKCIICDNQINAQVVCICLTCQNKCEVIIKPVPHEQEPSNNLPGFVDVKSRCCNSDVNIHSKSTCSKQCHEDLVNELERLYGKYKRIEDIHTGKAYRVPTRDIIEYGVNYLDLVGYPEW